MDWSRIQTHYEAALNENYAQPDESGRINLAGQAIQWAMREMASPSLPSYVSDRGKVLDIGCGEAYAQEIFEGYGFHYTGIAWGQDVEVGKAKGRNVLQMDMHSMDFEDKSFSLGFSSHSWEHSPMPYLALLEMIRVVKDYLIIVLPHPAWYKMRGRGHFSCMIDPQVANLCEHAGVEIKKMFVHERLGSPDFASTTITTPDEYWYLIKVGGNNGSSKT